MIYRYRYNLHEVLNILEDEEFDTADIFLEPPEDNAHSDGDSGDEDIGGNINNLSGNQLRARASAIVRTIHGKDAIGNIDTNNDELQDSSSELESSSDSENNDRAIDSDATVDYDALPMIDEPDVSDQQQMDKQDDIDQQQVRQRLARPVRQRAPRGAHNAFPGNVAGQRQQRNRVRARGRGQAVHRQWRRQDIRADQTGRYTWNMQPPEFLRQRKDPVELFELFFDDEVCSMIKDNSVTYAQQQGNHNFRLTIEEVKLFLAVLLVSGYNTLPRRRMYWDQERDTKNEFISEAFSKNRFEEIMRYLHVCDNNNLDPNDKLAKIRPLYAMINDRCLLFYPGEQKLSIDESMIPYFGRHSAKQFIKGKPIRFGYKLWCLNTRLGYLVQFEPYTGAGAGQHEFGLGGGVVLDLISELPPNQHYLLYFDNLFTSIRLLDRLYEMGIGGTGTVRANRLEKCVLRPLKGTPRGTYDYKYSNKTLLVEWNDNNIVNIASNCFQAEPTRRVRRWSKQQRTHIHIDQPKLIGEYNRYMGGVDRMDQNIGTYRISIRSKKWWWPFFAFMPDMVMQNAWNLYRLTPKYQEEPLDLLAFRRSVCKVYLMRFSQRVSLGRPVGRPLALHKRVPDAVRLDGTNHLIQPGPTQRVCMQCKKKSTRICSKCNVGLHDRCFVAFHSP